MLLLFGRRKGTQPPPPSKGKENTKHGVTNVQPSRASSAPPGSARPSPAAPRRSATRRPRAARTCAPRAPGRPRPRGRGRFSSSRVLLLLDPAPHPEEEEEPSLSPLSCLRRYRGEGGGWVLCTLNTNKYLVLLFSKVKAKAVGNLLSIRPHKQHSLGGRVKPTLT